MKTNEEAAANNAHEHTGFDVNVRQLIGNRAGVIVDSSVRSGWTAGLPLLRRSKKFFDSVFECRFCAPDRGEQLEAELSSMNALKVARTVSESIEVYRQGTRAQFEKKQEIFAYLRSRGIEFEINSKGTDILISACAALQDLFQLYPREVYHHFI